MEHADGRRKSRAHLDIKFIPEFRRYLEECGKTFEQWEAEQPAPDFTNEMLNLERRRVDLKLKGTK